MSEQPQSDVTRNEAESRWEVRVDGALAGIAEYQITDDVVVLTHTEVADEWEGHGVGSALVRGALDAVREEGTRQVLPQCPFVASWIEHHPEYQSLVAAPA